MNERIKELADRAGEYADFESGLCTDDFLKKFAELIVKECIDVAEQTRYDGKVVAKRIKFVFGIEE